MSNEKSIPEIAADVYAELKAVSEKHDTISDRAPNGCHNMLSSLEIRARNDLQNTLSLIRAFSYLLDGLEKAQEGEK